MWWAGAAALAGTEVDDAEIQRVVAELHPRVAEALGRTPMGPLRSGILPRERVRAAILAPTPAIGVRRPDPEEVLAPSRTRELLERQLTLAVYVGQLRGVYVVQEAVDALSAMEEPAHLWPVLRCLVVHELVHAVQHPYGAAPVGADPDQADGWSALREGHATFVGLELCAAWEGPAVARRVAAIQGVDAVGTLDPEHPATPYAYGRALAERLYREDPELVWSALAGPPPRWSDLVRDVRPILGGGWEDPAPVIEALRILGASGARPHADSPRTLAPLLGEAPGGFALPPATAGWAAQTGAGILAVYRMAEDGAAASLIEARRGRPPTESRQTRTRLGRWEGRADIVDTLGIAGRRYNERWVATERVLAVVVTRGRARPSLADRALASLLDQLPPVPPTGPAEYPALAGWLAEARDRRPTVEPTPDPDWRLLDAATAWERGVAAPCGPAFADVLVPGAVRDPERWARGAYDCAAAAHELATADLAARLLAELPAIPAAIHAQGLLAAGRFDAAFAVLAKARPSTPDQRRALADVRIDVAIAARRWGELAAAAALPDGSPVLRVHAAVVLRQHGRSREATHVFAVACFTGEGPPPEPCTSGTVDP